VWRDIDAATAHGLAPEVARAVSAAGELAESDPERARGLLQWAKETAPRSAAVREALGVDAYRQADFEAAARELAAYRRLSGRQDQNHLLADSLRATGRSERIRELVQAMGDDVEEERRFEAHMVHAGALADAGDVLRAREVLDRVGAHPGLAGPHHLRLWYMAAELSLELGDRDRAVELLGAVVAIDPDFLDAADRLAELEGEDGGGEVAVDPSEAGS
jgi:tetratricopeptide (TPR) repeat protein